MPYRHLFIAISASFYCNYEKWKQTGINNIKDRDIQYIKNFIKAKFSDESTIYSVVIDGKVFKFSDLVTSWTVPACANEIGNPPYDFSNIDFKEGDVIIDIGGNIGMVSIYLAKKFPFLKIYAFEPVKVNYDNFVKNIRLNNIPDGVITVEHCAVTKDGRTVNLMIDTENIGGSCISDVATEKEIKNRSDTGVPSITLNEIFRKYDIKQCKLLKVDCEGSEYEIFRHTDVDILKSCENLRAEFHESELLIQKFGPAEALLSFVKQYIKNVEIVKNTLN